MTWNHPHILWLLLAVIALAAWRIWWGTVTARRQAGAGVSVAHLSATVSTGRERLRQGLLWSNPLAIFLWRKFSRRRGRPRPWKQLAGLAAGSPGDYPIVPLELAPLLGTACFHVAICRGPK